MSVAQKLRSACEHADVEYETITHERTGCSQESAHAAHVPGRQLAKGVLLKDERGPVLAVLPACQHVDTDRLNDLMDRHLTMMSEKEFTDIFDDCSPGAIPITGHAYNLLTVTDLSLFYQQDIWMEAGDHLNLVHVSGTDFARLMQHTSRAKITSSA
ncbi:MAG: YbaK/EbsC family protein [Polyangiaceae bacterium]|nr:YbaK/EbsC family protein [Polyangiaceae bacterium]